jgi:hypothetical protein
MSKTKNFSALILAGFFSVGAVAAVAADEAALPETPAPETQIPFASKGGIWSWRVVDNKTVLIESRGRKWYKATLFSNCINLPFSERMTFVPNASGSFDRFSTIRVGSQRCPLSSLVATSAPPKKAKQPAKADAAAAGAVALPKDQTTP